MISTLRLTRGRVIEPENGLSRFMRPALADPVGARPMQRACVRELVRNAIGDGDSR